MEMERRAFTVFMMIACKCRGSVKEFILVSAGFWMSETRRIGGMAVGGRLGERCSRGYRNFGFSFDTTNHFPLGHD